MEVIKCVLEEGAGFPTRGSEGAACWDIYAAEDAVLRPYAASRIATNLRVELPKGHVLLLLPRSGFSFKNQIILPNSLGVIDEDYRGLMSLTAMWMPDPVSVLEVRSALGFHGLQYRADAVFRVEKGDRITQAMLLEYKEQKWEMCDALSPTARGDGGFGSTGLRTTDPS